MDTLILKALESGQIIPLVFGVACFVMFEVIDRISKSSAERRSSEDTIAQQLLTQNKEERDAERRERLATMNRQERLVAAVERLTRKLESMETLVFDVNERLSLVLKNGDTK